MTTKRSILRLEETTELASLLRLESLQRSNLLIEERAKMVWIVRIFVEQRPSKQAIPQGTAVLNDGATAEKNEDEEYLDPKEAAGQVHVGVPEDNEFFIQFKEAKEREKLELRQRDWERYESEARQLRREALEKHNADALLVLHSLKKPKKNFTREEVPSFLLRQSFLKDAALQVGEEMPNDQQGLLPPESPPPLCKSTGPRQRGPDKEKKQSRAVSQRLSGLLVPLRPQLDSAEQNLAEPNVPIAELPLASCSRQLRLESPRNQDIYATLEGACEPPPTLSQSHHVPVAEAPTVLEKSTPTDRDVNQEPADDVEVMLREQEALQHRLADISAALAKKLCGQTSLPRNDVHVADWTPTLAAEQSEVSAVPAKDDESTAIITNSEDQQVDLPPVATEQVARSEEAELHADGLTEKEQGDEKPAAAREGDQLERHDDEQQAPTTDDSTKSSELGPLETDDAPTKNNEAGATLEDKSTPAAHEAAETSEGPVNAPSEGAVKGPSEGAVKGPSEEVICTNEPREMDGEAPGGEPIHLSLQGEPAVVDGSPLPAHDEKEVPTNQPEKMQDDAKDTPLPAEHLPLDDQLPVDAPKECAVAEKEGGQPSAEEEAEDPFVDALSSADLQLLFREESYFRARLRVTESEYRKDLHREEQHRLQFARIHDDRTFAEQACETTPRLRGPPDPEQESLMEEEAFLRDAIVATERHSAELLLQRVEELLEEHAELDIASPKRTERIQQQLFRAEHDSVFQEENRARLQIIATYNQEIVEGVASVFNLSMLVLNLAEEEFTNRLQISLTQSSYLTFIRRYVRYVHTSDVIAMSSDQLRENMFQYASSAIENRKLEQSSVGPSDVLQAQEQAGRRETIRKWQNDSQGLTHMSMWLAGCGTIGNSQQLEFESAMSDAAHSLLLDSETERRRSVRLIRLELFDRHVEEQDSVISSVVEEKRVLFETLQSFRQLCFDGVLLVRSQEAISDSFVECASREYHVFSEFAAQQLSKHHERSIRLIGKEVDGRNVIEGEEAFSRSVQLSFVRMFSFKLLLVDEIFVDSCRRAYDESCEKVAQATQRAALRKSMRKALSEANATYDKNTREQVQQATAAQAVEQLHVESTPALEKTGVDEAPTETVVEPRSVAEEPVLSPIAEQKQASKPRPPEDPFHRQMIETRETSVRQSISGAAAQELDVIAAAEVTCASAVKLVEEFADVGSILLSRIFTDGIQLALSLHKISKAELEARGLMEYDSLLWCSELHCLVGATMEIDSMCTQHCANAVTMYESAIQLEAMKAANYNEISLEGKSRQDLEKLEGAQWSDVVRAHHILISRCVLYRVVKQKMSSCYQDVGSFFMDSLMCAVPAEESERRDEIIESAMIILRNILRASTLFVGVARASERVALKFGDVYISACADSLLHEDALYRKETAQQFIAHVRRLGLEEAEGTRRIGLSVAAWTFARPILAYGEILNRSHQILVDYTASVTLAHRSAFAAVLDAANRRVKLLEELRQQRADTEESESEGRAVLLAAEEAFFITGAQRYRRYIEAVTGFEKKCVALKITFCEQFEAKFQQQLQRRGTMSELRRTSTVATLSSVPSMAFTTEQEGSQLDQRYTSMSAHQMAAQLALSELDSMPQGLRDWGAAVCKCDPSVNGITLSNLSEDVLTDRVIQNLVAILAVRPAPLGFVDLSGSTPVATLLPSVLKLFRLVRELNLTGCGLDAAHEGAIANALSDPSNSLVMLRTLNLDGNNFSATCCTTFGRVIRNTNFQLTKLTLTGNPLIPQNQQRLVQFLCDCNRHEKSVKARILALESKQREVDADFSARLLQSSPSTVDLGAQFERVLDDITARCICVALSSNENCTQVSIRGHKLTDRAATLFAHLLRTNASLTHIDLSYNLIGDKGAGELAAALQTNTTLLELRLEGNQISDLSILTQVSEKCRRNAHETIETATYSARERNGT